MRGAFSTPSAALSTFFSLNFTDLATKLNAGQRRDKNGAGERSRTPDRLITSQLLYQLSYASPIPSIVEVELSPSSMEAGF